MIPLYSYLRLPGSPVRRHFQKTGKLFLLSRYHQYTTRHREKTPHDAEIDAAGDKRIIISYNSNNKAYIRRDSRRFR